MLTEGITKGSHQREYIIGTLCQSSSGPIAFASITYFFFLFFFFFLRKICRFPERLKNENIDEKDRKNVCLQNSNSTSIEDRHENQPQGVCGFLSKYYKDSMCGFQVLRAQL